METPQKKSRLAALKFTRRSAAIIVALLMVAAPAGASIIVQNFMEADITAAPPCFVKTTGSDPLNSSQASFDASGANTIAVDGVDLLEEKITVNGMTGDRVIYTDVVRYENNCLEPIDVVLTTNAVAGDWTNLAAEIWISNIAAPAAVDPNLDGVGGDWNDDYIIVPAGTTAGAFVDSTGVITVAPGAEVQGAFVVSSDVAFTAGTATVNWVAQATIN